MTKYNLQIGRWCERCVSILPQPVQDLRLGYCSNRDSDHYGHALNLGHPGCEKFKTEGQRGREKRD